MAGRKVISAFHRKFQQRAISAGLHEITLQEFLNEMRRGAFRWLPLSERVFERAELVDARWPATIFLRAADALHLSTASENGFRDVHSNDRNVLRAAPHFGLRGLNVID
jgi:predicted nucleic acid-binding protein